MYVCMYICYFNACESGLKSAEWPPSKKIRGKVWQWNWNWIGKVFSVILVFQIGREWKKAGKITKLAIILIKQWQYISIHYFPVMHQWLLNVPTNLEFWCRQGAAPCMQALAMPLQSTVCYCRYLCMSNSVSRWASPVYHDYVEINSTVIQDLGFANISARQTGSALI